MVHEKSKHLLADLYRGRLDGDLGDTAAFSDVYTLKRMSASHPGKPAPAPAPFEFVSDSNMDFENFKNRPEFSDEHGGEGSVYGGASTIGRPDSPGSVFADKRGRSGERIDGGAGVEYPQGYHHTPSALREYSPSPSPGLELRTVDSRASDRYGSGRDDVNLVQAAAPMGGVTPGVYTAYSPQRERERGDYFGRR